MTTAYQERVNAENLAAQAAPVQQIIKGIEKEIQAIQRSLYWALDPEEKYPLDWTTSLIERAHALVDLGHEYRQALTANPPPKIPVEDDEEDLTNTR